MQNPTHSPTPRASAANVGFSQSDMAGRYAFRFSGFAMRNNILYHLSGVGTFEIDAQGKLTKGQQRSSITPLQGQAAGLATATFDLSGTITLKPDGTGDATIHFKEVTSGVELDGHFFTIVAGAPDRLWLVSSGATVPPRAPVDELVSGEAIRMP
ncbi:MAG: hypothetical protein JO358_06630 [Alphaproteobacteria bacterium]|nr:hypothetical protein [Alphaproteobacteria bacterium]